MSEKTGTKTGLRRRKQGKKKGRRPMNKYDYKWINGDLRVDGYPKPLLRFDKIEKEINKHLNARVLFKFLWNCNDTIVQLSEFDGRKLYVRKFKSNGDPEKKIHVYGNASKCLKCRKKGKVCGAPIAMTFQYDKNDSRLVLTHYKAKEIDEVIESRWDEDIATAKRNWVQFEKNEVLKLRDLSDNNNSNNNNSNDNSSNSSKKSFVQKFSFVCFWSGLCVIWECLIFFFDCLWLF